MGDSTTNVSAQDASAEPNEQTTSKDILRESKPSANISIKAPSSVAPLTESAPKEGTLSPSTGSAPAKIETVFEKLDLASDKSDSTTDSVESARAKESATSKATVESVASKEEAPKQEEEKQRAKNRSSIFGQDVDKKGSATIFSVKGTPSGRLNRRRDLSSTVFPVGCMGCKELDKVEVIEERPKESKSRPSSAQAENQNRARNPLTGVGYTEDVKRSTSGRRRDGNPVLGLGYETEVQNTPSSNRIPPGGFSKGLW